MKKNIRVVLMAIVALLVTALTITTVYATNSIKITKKTYYKTAGRSHAIFKTNHGYAYCVTPNINGPSQGTTLYLKKTLSGKDAKVFYYILTHDNPSNNNGFVYSQAAIWRYYNSYNPYSKSSTVYKKATSIINAAKKSTTAPGKVGIEVASSSSSMSISKDNKYYQSGKFTIKTTSKTKYTASVNGKAYIVNASGAKQSSFNSGDSFYVRVNDADVTKKLSFTVTIKTSGKNQFIRIYATKKGKYQNLVILDEETASATKQLSLSVTPVKRVCQYVNGQYYGINGAVVTHENYIKQCLHPCQEVNGKFYDDQGKEVDKITYYKVCKKPVCQKIDDTYFGKNGTVVTEEEFKTQCLHVCEKYNNEFYGPDGTVVTEEVYKDKCMPKCEEKDGKFFDDKGNEVDKITYYKVCKKPICQKIDDTYFGKDGNVVTEAEYSEQCVPKCYEKDGKFYDDKGNETDEVTYIKVCKKPICEKVGDNYFGKDGNVVTEEEYRKQCVHTCEIHNNQYYGKDGSVVNKDTYQAECEETTVVVPDTATNPLTAFLYIISGTLVVLGGLGFVGYQNKLSVK